MRAFALVDVLELPANLEGVVALNFRVIATAMRFKGLLFLIASKLMKCRLTLVKACLRLFFK